MHAIQIYRSQTLDDCYDAQRAEVECCKYDLSTSY